MDDDKTAQLDEILAIESIYPEILYYDGENRIYIDIPPIRLIVNTPARYPSQELPVIELNGPTLSSTQKNRLWDLINQECLDNLGMPLLFSIINITKEFIEEENLSQEEEVPSNVETNEVNEVDQEEISQKEALVAVETSGAPLLNILHGDVLTDRRSHFQAHLYPTQSKEEVSTVLKQLLCNNKIARATHNMVAWRIKTQKNGKEIVMHDCDDDGEHGASSKMLELLEKMGAENVMVVVSRWYGGIQLGPDRFKHINNVTREILAAHGYDKRGN